MKTKMGISNVKIPTFSSAQTFNRELMQGSRTASMRVVVKRLGLPGFVYVSSNCNVKLVSQGSTFIHSLMFKKKRLEVPRDLAVRIGDELLIDVPFGEKGRIGKRIKFVSVISEDNL